MKGDIAMNEKDRLQKLIDWVRAKGRRHIDIAIGDPSDNNYLEIWAYDYSLQTGKYIKVNDIDELDLEREAEKEKRKQYEKLKAIYEHEPKEATNNEI